MKTPKELARTLESIASNVRRLRLSLGLTQAKLADKAKLDLRYIQHLERGNTNLSIDVLIRLAAALATAPTALFRPGRVEPARPGRPPKVAPRGAAKVKAKAKAKKSTRG